MKEFMLLFRQPSYDYSNASPKEMQTLAKKWQEWAGSIAAQGKLASHGPRLARVGDKIELNEAAFLSLSETFFAEIESKYL